MTHRHAAGPIPSGEDDRHLSIVSVQGLSKGFRVRTGPVRDFLRTRARPRVHALADVTFDVAPGTLFGVLGPNGAGKSTLFKTLSGLLLPDLGQVSVEGLDVVRHPGRVRRIVTPVVPDERSLFWRLSALENLRLFASLLGLPRREAVTRAEACLARVGLEDSAHRLVGPFSSGMKQRLLLARALLGSPRVLLLDEPTRSMDPLAARSFRRFVRDELVDGSGMTVLLATHDTEEALRYCDRMVVMDRGRIVAEGSADDLQALAASATHRAVVRDDPEARRLVEQGAALRVGDGGTPPGWLALDVQVRGGVEGGAHALGALRDAGVTVAAFKEVEPTLADLLERLVASDGTVGRA